MYGKLTPLLINLSNKAGPTAHQHFSVMMNSFPIWLFKLPDENSLCFSYRNTPYHRMTAQREVLALRDKRLATTDN